MNDAAKLQLIQMATELTIAFYSKDQTMTERPVPKQFHVAKTSDAGMLAVFDLFYAHLVSKLSP